MKRIPHANGVTRAVRALQAATKKAAKGLNQTAAMRTAKGDYETAEILVAKGRELREFQAEIDALGKRWRAVASGGAASATNGKSTPLWQYFQPILQALVHAGGESRRVDLEASVERAMSASLTTADRSEMSRGRQRWRVMILRAHKPMVAEGWIEKRVGKTWKITDAGRRAAERPIQPR